MEQVTSWLTNSMLLFFLGVAAYFDCKRNVSRGACREWVRFLR